MKVTICSSSRYYSLAKEVADKLESEGAEVFTPNFVYNETSVEVDEKTKAELTQRFFSFIEQCDCLYVISTDGYIGISVALEIGYASAPGKPIYLSEMANDFAIRSLTKSVVSTSEVSKILQ